MIYALVEKATGQVVEIYHTKKIDPTTPTKPGFVWAPYEVITESANTSEDYMEEEAVRSFVKGKLVDTVVLRDKTEEEKIQEVSKEMENPLYKIVLELLNEVRKLKGEKVIEHQEYISLVKDKI